MTANIYKQHALEGCLLWETCNLLRRKNALLSSQHCSTSKANLQNNQHHLAHFIALDIHVFTNPYPSMSSTWPRSPQV